MKRALISMAAMFMFVGLVSLVQAADKEIAVTGKLTCAKCDLKESGVTECQNVLVAKEGTYYLAKNKVSDDFHKQVCKAAKEGVTVHGTVAEKDGKKTITASKIEAGK